MDLEPLRAVYRETLGRKAAVLESLNPALAKHQAQIREIAHGLAGSAGSYGFVELGETARALEECGEAEFQPALSALLTGLKAHAMPPGTRARLPDPPAKARKGLPRILLADDDDAVAAIVVHKLQADGYQVVRVGEGDAALQHATAGGFVLFIFDVSMPGLDGFELLRAVKAHPSLAGVPVLMLTAKRKGEDVIQGINLGVSEYMIKPFMAYELLERVRSLTRTR